MRSVVDAIQKATGIDAEIIWRGIVVFVGIGIVVQLHGAISNWRLKNQRDKTARRIVADVRKTALTHVGTLSRKKAQLVSIGDYGEAELDAYHRELNHFYDKIVLPVIAGDMNSIGLAEHLPSHEENLKIIAQTVDAQDAKQL